MLSGISYAQWIGRVYELDAQGNELQDTPFSERFRVWVERLAAVMYHGTDSMQAWPHLRRAIERDFLTGLMTAEETEVAEAVDAWAEHQHVAGNYPRLLARMNAGRSRRIPRLGRG
jgi:hypothetical protein